MSEIAATRADGMLLADILRHSHQLRHRAERNAFVIHIQTADYHPNTCISQLVAHVNNTLVEKLDFIDGHHLDIVHIDVQ